ncbi:PTS mannitol transporter subunit IIB [Microbacterium mangrovi]|uniref:PTS system mannitol-specific EIICB component n=1 Tax=Microbacterium mangrovi TaxID=1348253 RepID=A0A0B2ACW8_9MICO|nr:PTS mannitol transporter subunit IICB [Microbacterium mangrovi]KHK99491.1 PTS mannitol transporter subunit IIB [Microbacterium mangrovi]
MTTTSPPAAAPVSGGRRATVHIQRFGTFLSGMIMPNIAAFIAWGFITALFIATGWLGWWHPIAPVLGGFGNANDIGWQHAMTQLAQASANGATFPQYVGLVVPMITYLLPLLIANTGGRMVYGERGGVVASIATLGVIVGTTIPMFLGAMVMGPFAALVTKWMDRLWDGKIRPGFEMLVNNFSAGILGMILAIVGFFVFGPVMTYISDGLGAIVHWLTAAHLLPALSIIVEPAKVLFLNNAVNHGVFTPIGTQQALATGRSILFLVEANPGPGLGILLAYTFFGIGAARASAPGAIIIQFFGGIHEIYFPYVLMKPILVVAAILGGMTGVATNALFGSGLRAPAAPGSIIAVVLQTSGDSNFGRPWGYVGVLLSVALAATVSCVVASIFLRASRKRDLAAGGGDLDAAIAATQANKGKDSAALSGLRTRAAANAGAAEPTSLVGAQAADAAIAGGVVTEKRVDHIVFACDAGMGSSAMGASVLRNKIKKAGVEGVTVVNQAIANLDGTADLVITQNQLTERARDKSPESIHVSVDNFMNAPQYDEVVDLVRRQHEDQ